MSVSFLNDLDNAKPAPTFYSDIKRQRIELIQDHSCFIALDAWKE